MRITSKQPRHIISKIIVLCLACFALPFLSGCSNKARIETTKNDFLAYSNFVAEGNGANLKDLLESKKGNFKAWKKTAGKKIPEGQILLGLSYFHGVGTRENKKEAVNWFRKAAEQGFAEGGSTNLAKPIFLERVSNKTNRRG